MIQGEDTDIPKSGKQPFRSVIKSRRIYLIFIASYDNGFSSFTVSKSLLVHPINSFPIIVVNPRILRLSFKKLCMTIVKATKREI